MSDEHDSWLQNAFGLDVGQALQKIKDEASSAIGQAAETVTEVVQDVRGVVEGALDAAAGAAKKISGAVPPTASGAPARSGVAGGTGSFPLGGSVGRGGKNAPKDVRAVQKALSIAADGQCGGQTIAAIEAFQRNHGLPKADGRVDPGGATERAMSGSGGGAGTASSTSGAAAADDSVGLWNQIQQGAADLGKSALGAIESADLLNDTGAGLNSPSYVNAQDPNPNLGGGGVASAGDSTFVTGIPKNGLIERSKAVIKAGQDLIKLGTDIEAKGKHYIRSNDTDLLATGKAVQDAGKATVDLGSAIDKWSGNLNESALKDADKANKYFGYVLKALDTVKAANAASLSLDNMDKKPSQESVEAWADNVGNLFDKAGGLIDLIPDGALPGFVADYYKGLFSAPKNYIAAFKRIMHAHYAAVDKDGEVDLGKGERARNWGTGTTEWEGKLSGVYVQAYFQQASAKAGTLQAFMKAHQDEDGLDLKTATLEAGKAALIHRVESNLAWDDPARAAWVSFLSK